MRIKQETGEIYEGKRYQALQKQVYRMGVNRSYRGFGLVIEAALMLKQDESLGSCMKVVFIDVAIKNHTSKENVERDIRTLVQAVWKYGDKEVLEEMAGKRLDKPPTCQEFVGILADYMRRKDI